MTKIVLGLLLICAGCVRPINQLNTVEVKRGSKCGTHENTEVHMYRNDGYRVSGSEVREGNAGA